jgi:hypothetical protein
MHDNIGFEEKLLNDATSPVSRRQAEVVARWHRQFALAAVKPSETPNASWRADES